jgi:hypothetical protein
MRIIILLLVGLLAACGPRTGFGTAACERAEEDLRAAVDASAPDYILRRTLDEMERACEIDASEQSEPEPTPTPAAASTERPLGPNTYFVSVDMTEERSSPNGPVVNRIYRGQRLEVTDRDGAWVRVTELRYDPRWVRTSDLSRERPQELPQPDLPPNLNDERIQGIPAVGEDGHTEDDVRALRMAAALLLASGECRSIEIGSESVNQQGLYWVNCGENSNRFFKMVDGEPRLCGRSAAACR